MALDEAFLLHGPSEGATLRLYTWAPDTLSLGYFQRLADVPPAERWFRECFPNEAADRESPTDKAPSSPMPGAVVRRLTGGGAIHHQSELTFSITAPLDHPLYRGPTEHSYERVHAAIAVALTAAGVIATPRGDRELSSERTATGMCFHKSASVDLVWDGRKGVGSAQRRKGGRVLHHGSIKLDTTPLEGEIATLAPGAATPASLGAELRAALVASPDGPDELVDLAPDEFEGAVREHAQRRAPFFGSAAFLARR